VAEPTGTQALTEDAGLTAADEAEHVSEYTTESAPVAESQPAVPVVTGTAVGTGRRKEAIARVRIVPGTGQWRVNDRSLEDFFPNKVHQQLIREPLANIDAENQFDVFARIAGGGITGQAGALRLGIARALTVVDPANRGTLKRAGFLTRDARAKERKKYGLKKARKAPQYSKR